VHALPQPPGPYPMAMFAVYVAPGAMGPAFHAEFFQMFPLVSLILYERKVIAVEPRFCNDSVTFVLDAKAQLLVARDSLPDDVPVV